MKVVRYWNRLHSVAVNASSLEAFKARLEGALSSLGLEEGVPACSRGLELDDLKDPFQLKPFYDSMIAIKVNARKRKLAPYMDQ